MRILLAVTALCLSLGVPAAAGAGKKAQHKSGKAASRPAKTSSSSKSIEKTFREADKDHNGLVDHEEYMRKMADIFFLVDKNRDGYLDLKELPKAIPGQFEIFDINGDGRLSLPEFLHAREADFKRADTDKDGKLSLEEVRRYK